MVLSSLFGLSGLELLRQAVAHDDGDAWAGLEQCFGEIVRSWLHSHPSKEAALRWEREEYYITLAFERFRQAAIEGPMAFSTLAEALVYLRASLNGVILEMLRTHARPTAVPRPVPGGEPPMEDREDSQEVWEALHSVLPSKREQRLAFLLYNCGLAPREIVRCCQEEWSDVQEIYHLRYTILERLLLHADQLSLATHTCE